MILLYLLMLMWPPPHLLRNAVGVWRHESPAFIDALTRPPRQRAIRRRHRSWSSVTRRGCRQRYVPVVASFLENPQR
jgi:hypothetical protein